MKRLVYIRALTRLQHFFSKQTLHLCPAKVRVADKPAVNHSRVDDRFEVNAAVFLNCIYKQVLSDFSPADILKDGSGPWMKRRGQAIHPAW